MIRPAIFTSHNKNHPESNCLHKNAKVVVNILKMSVLFKLVHKTTYLGRVGLNKGL